MAEFASACAIRVDGQIVGSGVVVAGKRRSFVVTAKHVIHTGKELTVLFSSSLTDGTAQPAELLEVHPSADLAVLAVPSIPTGCRRLPLVPVDVLKSRDPLALAGYGPPTSDAPSETWAATGQYVGELSNGFMNLDTVQVNRKASGGGWYSELDGGIVGIQTDVLVDSTDPQNENTAVAVRAEILTTLEMTGEEFVILRGAGPRGRTLRGAAITFHTDSVAAQIIPADNGALRSLRPTPAQIAMQPDSGEPFSFPRHAIVYGPPEVGKTTWAVREMLAFEAGSGPESALYFDLKVDSPDELGEAIVRLGRRLDDERPIGVFLDDAHFLGREESELNRWCDQVQGLLKRRSHLQDDQTVVVWIARTANPVMRIVVDAEPIPFPADRIPTAFHNLAPNRPWYGLLAAFETQLDPGTLTALREYADRIPNDAPEDLSEWERIRRGVERLAAEKALRWVLDQADILVPEIGGSEAFDLFMLLLPIATLDMPIPTATCRQLMPVALRAVRLLERHGLAASEVVSGSGKAQRLIRINVHAYQAARTLDRLDESELPDAKPLSTALRSLAQPPNMASVGFAYRVISALVQDIAEHPRAYDVDDLVERAQWTGVPEIMCGGLEAWASSGVRFGPYVGKTQAQVDAGTGKLIRLSRRPEDIARSLDVPREYWGALAAAQDTLTLGLALASRCPHLAPSVAWAETAFDEAKLHTQVAEQPIRPDRALYEIGYRYHLAHRYHDAGHLMKLSMAVALAGVADSYSVQDISGVFGNIWVSASVAYETDLYAIWSNALSESRRCTTEEVEDCKMLVRKLQSLAQNVTTLASKQLDPDSALSFLEAEVCKHSNAHERLNSLKTELPLNKCWERAAQMWEYAERSKYWGILLGVITELPAEPVWGKYTADLDALDRWIECERQAERRSEYVVSYSDRLARSLRADWQNNNLEPQALTQAMAAAMLDHVQGPPEGLAWHLILASRVAADQGREDVCAAIQWIATRYTRDYGSGHLARLALLQANYR